MTTTEPADPSATSPFDIAGLLDAAEAVDLKDTSVIKACCARPTAPTS